MSHVFSYTVIPASMTSALLVPPLTTSERDEHAYQNLSIAGEVVLLD